jgi:hypothetical protein
MENISKKDLIKGTHKKHHIAIVLIPKKENYYLITDVEYKLFQEKHPGKNLKDMKTISEQAGLICLTPEDITKEWIIETQIKGLKEENWYFYTALLGDMVKWGWIEIYNPKNLPFALKKLDKLEKNRYISCLIYDKVSETYTVILENKDDNFLGDCKCQITLNYNGTFKIKNEDLEMSEMFYRNFLCLKAEFQLD